WVAIGSGYYHLWPDNSTLLWDRLPMTVAFMALFSIVLSEFVSTRFSKSSLILLVAFGVFSVVYWHITELNGAGDLRLYILVQFLPMVLIPLLLLLCCEKSVYLSGYWALLFWYVVAKLCEYFDQAIFDLLGVISGHSLKHIAAALGVLFLLLAYRRKNPM
ncbi:MAG: alkaline phytoceramidase, partial [Gammaproteobacteria bacterium]|nr:alkaline phytoceramidase [Gammaproteobacteria bacterium]